MNTNGYHQALKDNESLVCLMRKMREFDKEFVDLIASGEEFVLRLEIRGHGGQLKHARVYHDSIDRPKLNGRVEEDAEETVAFPR